MDWTDAERAHQALLERWRTAMNLVGPGDPEHHFVDSAAAVSGLPAVGRWIDLGSGAGLGTHNPNFCLCFFRVA